MTCTSISQAEPAILKRYLNSFGAILQQCGLKKLLVQIIQFFAHSDKERDESVTTDLVYRE